MKRTTLLFALGIVAVGRYSPCFPVPVIADHSVVVMAEKIPARWIDSVKTMQLAYPGESHGKGLLYGMKLLQAVDNRFAVDTAYGKAPRVATKDNLRVHRARYDNSPALRYPAGSSLRWRESGGEEHMWTSSFAVSAVKAQITMARDTLRNPYRAFTFGWCWDMCWQAPCVAIGEWAGRAYYWGDSSCTGTSCWRESYVNNWDTTETRINLQMYLDVWDALGKAFPSTAMIYSTGPVDGSCKSGCKGFQRNRKHEFIRNWVKRNVAGERFLFDYADILSWNNEGERHTVTEGGYTFQAIHPDNDAEYDGGTGSCHISEEGTVRLAKAMWWLLARVAGWDGVTDGTGIR
ncbi:MAG: hypothetical protein JW768_12620 [Chitinispirillaceae bacterium]|nr:hypothetical protein [Chitinispirillaceae bacterium]